MSWCLADLTILATCSRDFSNIVSASSNSATVPLIYTVVFLFIGVVCAEFEAMLFETVKAVKYLLHKPGSSQVAILAVKHGTTVA